MTDGWNPTIPSHKALAHAIEFGNGIPEMRPLSSVRSALLSVGFEIEHEEDLAERDDPVPWYYPLEGDISQGPDRLGLLYGLENELGAASL